MHFYIVTPTYNALSWLQCCIRSVSDQVREDVTVHHHVQDGFSSDGTPAWLEKWQKDHADIPGYTFTYESAKDRGMYDALNIAWSKLPDSADVTAHLNSDEQYLPGALAELSQVIDRCPREEIFVTSFIVVDRQGEYICHRRPVKPHRWSSLTVCEIITCSCFHRVGPFRRRGIQFDTQYRSMADLVFFRDIVNTSPKIRTCPGIFASVYTSTGNNLAWQQVSRQEERRYMNSLSPRADLRNKFAYRWVNGRRLLVDLCKRPPRSYSLYRLSSKSRSLFTISHPTARWNLNR